MANDGQQLRAWCYASIPDWKKGRSSQSGSGSSQVICPAGLVIRGLGFVIQSCRRCSTAADCQD